MNDKDWKEEFEKWDNLPVYQILSPEAYINWLKLNDPHIDFIIDEFCRSAWQAAVEYKQERIVSLEGTVSYTTVRNLKLEAENKKLREALEFYADIEAGNNDWGMRAREALKEVDEKP